MGVFDWKRFWKFSAAFRKIGFCGGFVENKVKIDVQLVELDFGEEVTFWDCVRLFFYDYYANSLALSRLVSVKKVRTLQITFRDGSY